MKLFRQNTVYPDIQIDVSQQRFATGSYFPHRQARMVYECGVEFVYRPERSCDSKMSFYKLDHAHSLLSVQLLWADCLNTHRTALFHKKSEMRSRKCVFLHPVRNTDFGYSRKDEPNVLPYSQLHLIVHTQLFPQHLLVAELLLLVFESILATSSLRESPDDRISSRPVLYSIPTTLMPLTARMRSPVLSF